MAKTRDVLLPNDDIGSLPNVELTTAYVLPGQNQAGLAEAKPL